MPGLLPLISLLFGPEGLFSCFFPQYVKEGNPYAKQSPPRVCQIGRIPPHFSEYNNMAENHPVEVPHIK
jgi:hypothetical protein